VLELSDYIALFGEYTHPYKDTRKFREFGGIFEYLTNDCGYEVRKNKELRA
jgi:hypothetical protein